jgi:hypothetical protein
MNIPNKQFVVQTTTKRSGWGWESYFETEESAINHYKRSISDKAYRTVRIYWQGFDAAGDWRTGSIDIKE